MDKNTISHDGTSIAYESSGQGPAVILVSGAMSTGGTVAPLAVPSRIASGLSPTTVGGAGRAVTPSRTRWSARSRILPR